MLPWILTNWFNVSNTAPEGVNPDSVKWSFYIGALVFILAILWTVIKSKEYSPEELESFEENKEKETFIKEYKDESEIIENGKKQMRRGGLVLLMGSMLTLFLSRQDLQKELYIVSFGAMAFGFLLIASGLLQRNKNYKNGFVTIMNDFQEMPSTMKQLAGVQFFSWFALFSMWIYATAAVTAHIYGTTDTSSDLYNQGANWVGVCFAVYNGVAAAIAFLIPVLAKKTSRKTAHAICLVLGAIGLSSIFIIQSPNLLILSMIGIGIAWASILSMPYAILTGALPANKMGYYMGVFNFFIVIPQLVAAAILGFFIARFFGGEAIYAMLIGGVSLIIAAILTMRVEDKDDQN